MKNSRDTPNDVWKIQLVSNLISIGCQDSGRSCKEPQNDQWLTQKETTQKERKKKETWIECK